MADYRVKEKRSKKNCCVGNHEDNGKGSPLGKRVIVAPINKKSILELLGSKTRGPISDDDVQEKMRRQHPYVFDMGGGKYFKNYEEAADELLARNFPEIAEDKQVRAVFVPETYLPRVPRAVDPEEFEIKMQSLSEEFRKNLEIAAGDGETQNLDGDLAEKEISDALKTFFSSWPNKEVVVFQGGIFKPPVEEKGCHQEHDFIIILKKCKCIICIESKKKLHSDSVKKGVKQLNKFEKLLSEYFGPMPGWSYVAWLHFQQDNSGLTICSECQENIILSPEDLRQKLINLLCLGINQATPDHEEYKDLVKRIAFILLSQDIGTPCTITSMVDSKVVGTVAKQGQGDVTSVIFWSLGQADLLLGYYPLVMFLSPWSTGKTVCMKEKAKRCAAEDKKVVVCVASYMSDKKTLLEMELEKELSHINNIKVTSIKIEYEATNLGSALLSLVQSHPGASFFIDEVVMPCDASELSSLSAEISKIVTLLQGGLLWISVAGIGGGSDMSTIASTMFMFHQPDLRIPLRSTREVLDMAGMANGTSANNLPVANGFHTGGAASYTIPPLLMPGLPGCKVMVDSKNKEEVVTAVKKTREHVSKTRAGTSGVPVLVCYSDKTMYSWVREGLAMADITGGTMDQTCRVICYTGYDDIIPDTVGEDVVADWLNGHSKGEEERDLVTDEHCSRGWEAMTVMIVDLGGHAGVENLVMRGRTYVAMVTHKE